jgi:hypothetical protein
MPPKGYKMSKTAKDKIREKLSGIKRSKTTCQKIGAAHWKGNNVLLESARKRARRIFQCPKGYQRHHVDGNPLNNDPSNIKIVTPKEHVATDKRWENRIRDSNGRFC